MLFQFSAAISSSEVIRHECGSYQAFGAQELLSLITAGGERWQTAVQSCPHLLWYVPVHLLCRGFAKGALPKVLCHEHSNLGRVPWSDWNDTSFGDQAQGSLIGWLRLLGVAGAWELCFCAVCLAVSVWKLKDFSGIMRAS